MDNESCNYGHDESESVEASWYYFTAGGATKYLCGECYRNATEILRHYCLPVG